MRKLIVFLLLFNSLFFHNVNSDEIKNIEINGNKRISDETIIVFSGINQSNEINSSSDLKIGTITI